MKKVLLSFSAIVAVMSASAQITVTSANLPVPGDIAELGIDTLVDAAEINPGDAGSNQTWDFTSADADVLRPVEYYDPAGTPGKADFPNATVVTLRQGQQGDVYTYFRVGADGMFELGSYNDQGGAQKNGEEIIVLETPMNFGDQKTNTTKREIKFGPEAKGFSGHDSTRIDVTTTTERDVNAWGTVKLPNKSYDALRSFVRVTIEVEGYGKDSAAVVGYGPWTYDPVFTELIRGFIGNGVQESYEWHTNDAGVKVALAEMVYQPDSAVQVPYFAFNYVEPVGLNELTNADVTVYPNPAADYVTVEMAEAVNGYVKVYNTNGQVVATEVMNANSVTVNTSSLPTGTYIVNVYDAKGSVKSINKVNVAK